MWSSLVCKVALASANLGEHSTRQLQNSLSIEPFDRHSRQCIPNHEYLLFCKKKLKRKWTYWQRWGSLERKESPRRVPNVVQAKAQRGLKVGEVVLGQLDQLLPWSSLLAMSEQVNKFGEMSLLCANVDAPSVRHHHTCRHRILWPLSLMISSALDCGPLGARSTRRHTLLPTRRAGPDCTQIHTLPTTSTNWKISQTSQASLLRAPSLPRRSWSWHWQLQLLLQNPTGLCRLIYIAALQQLPPNQLHSTTSSILFSSVSVLRLWSHVFAVISAAIWPRAIQRNMPFQIPLTFWCDTVRLVQLVQLIFGWKCTFFIFFLVQ